MARYKGATAVLLAGILLGGCETFEEMFPGLAGEESTDYETAISAPPSENYGAPAPSPNASPAPSQAAPTYEPQAPSTTAALYQSEGAGAFGAPTGTFVGQKVQQNRSELETLKARLGQRSEAFRQRRDAVSRDAQEYYATVAAINARLQIGTTPGNPVLVSQWNAAQSQLDRILADIASLNTLGSEVAGDSAVSSYLLQSVRAAYGLQGAIEEDHRQLALLEDELSRTRIEVDRLLTQVNATVNRYTNYVNNERRNLTTISVAIKNGQYYGTSFPEEAIAGAQTAPPAGVPAGDIEGPDAPSGQPLVIIRFDRPDVEYRQALYRAISHTLERRPDSTFDIVAVAPTEGTPAELALNTDAAKRNAEEVVQALSEMGLPSSRLSLSSTTRSGVYTNEVHIYVR